MAEIYEFRVAGLIGPVVRAAMPELSADNWSPHSVLTGTADGPDDVDGLLRRLTDHGLVASHIRISNQTRWRATGPTKCPVAGEDLG